MAQVLKNVDTINALTKGMYDPACLPLAQHYKQLLQVPSWMMMMMMMMIMMMIESVLHTRSVAALQAAPTGTLYSKPPSSGEPVTVPE
jgi:hypothetical protein